MELNDRINACTTNEQLDEILNEVLTMISNHAAHLSLKEEVGPLGWQAEVERHWKNFLMMQTLS